MVTQKVERTTAEQTAGAVTNGLGAVAEGVETITLDNGKEFAYHKQIAEALVSMPTVVDVAMSKLSDGCLRTSMRRSRQ